MSNIIKIKAVLKHYLNHNPTGSSIEGLTLMGIAALLEGIPTTHSMPYEVYEFHKHFGIEYEGKPRLLPEDLSKFRIARAKEEHTEYVNAITLENKLDALIDSIYIDLGTLHLHGFSPDAITKAWKRVHEANMKKVRTSELNPGKYGKLGCKQDITKPCGWIAPTFEDLCK
jgi:predicted HAD superfamily Cof-like phosphohydrolase